MKKTIDIGARLKASFGYVSKNESDSLRKQNFSNDNGISGSGVYVNDSTFEEFTLINNDNDELFFGCMISKRSEEGKVFAPPAMCSFRKDKRLIITEIDGAAGEIVEEYGNKSWTIKIEGILVDMVNHKYPKAQVKKLVEYFNVNRPLGIVGGLFGDLGINDLYLTDIDLSGIEGYSDTIRYTLSAKSIKPTKDFYQS